MKIAMVAGEASGDMLAGLLLDGLHAHWPDLVAQGIGGPQMQQRGLQAWWSHEKLAVHGYGWDVVMRYREIVGIRQQLQKRLLRERPDVFVGVDAPDFNLHLESVLKQNAIKTVHFISPSVWAWRAKRLEKIRRSVDHVLCIFPFEPALLAQHGIAATYVGHPLASIIPMEPDRLQARADLGLGSDERVLAILPGSRASEIKHLACRFFEAAALIRKTHPAIKIVVPTAPGRMAQVQQIAQMCGMAAHLQIVQGQAHAVLAACDVTLVASGTATLEAALFKRPMVIAYSMGWLSWEIMRRRRLQPWVGLPNILCQEFVVPELLQGAATAQNLARAVLQWFDAQESAPEKIAALRARFSALHTELQRDTSRIAADAIAKVLQQH